MTQDNQANDKPKRKLAQPTMSELEDIEGVASLRDAIEQEINTVSMGVSTEDFPEGIKLLIPSLDLQRAIDRIMTIAQAYTDRAVTLGRIDELNITQTVFPRKSPPNKTINDYITDRIDQLNDTPGYITRHKALTISVRDGGETSSQRGKT